VDWVEHANDVAAVLHEMLEFDQAIGVAMKFAETHPDTLVVVTADHDTGGLAIAYNSFGPPAPVKLASGETWKSKYNFNERVIFERMAAQKKSLFKMIADSKGDPSALKKQVEENAAFSISMEQAASALAKDPQLGFPVPAENKDFYVYGAMNPVSILSRILGRHMGTAWAVGTHTHTPVMVFAQGPSSYRFRGLLDNTHVPQIMADGWAASLPAPK
jgi:alkaline phosphatase